MAPELRARKATQKATPKSKVAATKRKAVDDDASPVAKKLKTAKAKSDTTKKTTKPSKGEETVDDDHPFSDDEEEILALAGVTASDDEDEVEDSELAFKEGQDVGKVPKVEKNSIKSKDSKETGVLYIGRLPHGFYERELKSYFEQFGPVINLRVSRNKKTAASKHFAFLEFAEESTARIVEKTMDGYLLFGHILRCRMVPKAQIHKDLWKGANRRFKAIPTNKLAGNNLKKPRTESQWGLKGKIVNKKRAAKAQKLQELGYDYEFSVPELKIAKAIAHDSEEPAALEDHENDAPKAIEAMPEAKETVAAESEQTRDELDVGGGVESVDEKLVFEKPKKAGKLDATKDSKKTKKSKGKSKKAKE